MEDHATLARAADRALNAAKRAGGNRIATSFELAARNFGSITARGPSA
jgi:hypothetical protein